MLIDQAQISVKAGDGGHGIIAFRREKFVPRGGPAGGDGGDGGDVWLEADGTLRTLRDFRYRRQYQAKNGAHGSGDKRSGRRGDDLVLRVPAGTEVYAADGTDLLFDLVEDGQRAQIAAGGRGGRGNAKFASPTDRTPERAEDGGPGEQCALVLKLKLLADAGLVGLPNAGKSSLLARISRATPKVAAYPFTTLEPNLGLVEAGGDLPPFVVADIPGLIEGAHTGAGLGHDFLRHIERTSVLLYVVDAGVEHDPEPLAALALVREEVEQYQPDLLERPSLVLFNKVDLPTARDRLPALMAAVRSQGGEPFAVSAATGEGITAVIQRTADLVGRAAAGAEGPADD